MNHINNGILIKFATIIDETGKNLGLMSITEALNLAKEKDLDLVEVSDNVCKIFDYSKYLYKQKKLSKPKKSPTLKEFHFSIHIQDHDINTKLTHIKELLIKGHPIKIIIQYVGREITHKQQGYDLVEKLKQQLNLYTWDPIKEEGNKLFMLIRK